MRRSKVQNYLDIAETVGQRGTCMRRNYGSVIVNNNIIVSTGYTGAPVGARNCCDYGLCIREEMNIPSGQNYELCLEGSTKVKLYDGGFATLEDLAYENEQGFYIKAVDLETGYYIRAIAYSPRKTGIKDDVAEVQLDNGTSFRCTEEHQIMVEGRTFVEAQNLKQGEILHGGRVVKDVISVPISIPMYDLTVPLHENFAIELEDGSEVYVHNCKSVHAEQNAIIQASMPEMIGSTLYLVGTEVADGSYVKDAIPCDLCKRMIINAQIREVVVRIDRDQYRGFDPKLWL